VIDRDAHPGRPVVPPAEIERLWRFLLNELSEPERIAIEDEFFVDDDRLAIVESAEDELIDAYARGELPEERRQRFEKRFLATASQRARVAFASALATLAADGARVPEADAPTPLRPRAPTAPSRRRLRPIIWQAAMAAALVLGLGALSPRLLGWRRVTEIDVALSPGSLRGEPEIPTVHVPAKKARLKLKLKLKLVEPLRDDGDTFDLLLRRELEQPKPLLASRAPDGESLTAALDPSGLAPGTYELTARARHRGGAAEDIAVYLFRIDTP
jgi:hypothetical protein